MDLLNSITTLNKIECKRIWDFKNLGGSLGGSCKERERERERERFTTWQEREREPKRLDFERERESKKVIDFVRERDVGWVGKWGLNGGGSLGRFEREKEYRVCNGH